MPSKRDITVDVLLARNDALADKLREVRRQLWAALRDNQELRRSVPRFRGKAA
jgi:hypothetical protein